MEVLVPTTAALRFELVCNQESLSLLVEANHPLYLLEHSSLGVKSPVACTAILMGYLPNCLSK